jgi:transposase
MNSTRFVGLDVHAETIAVAVAEPGGEIHSLGTIPNRPEAVRRLAAKLGPADRVRVCYEAGPCGYVLYWQLTALGLRCDVVAPTLVPVKAGDRVKTDRRDAEKLARSFRSGDLTPVWVPDAAHEALRDLVRAREAAKKDQLRARHRLSKFLLRQGRRPPAGTNPWSARHRAWLGTIRFSLPAHDATFVDYLGELDHAATRIERLEAALDTAVAQARPPRREVIGALQTLHGVSRITATTVAAELGTLTRFPSARDFMGYTGLVASEHSSGSRIRRGAITKTGNAHLRRVLVEAAWAYRHRPGLGDTLRKRQVGQPPAVCAIAWKAQHRLHTRFRRLSGRGKSHQLVVTALARELAGFIWAIGRAVEQPPAA